MAVDPYSPCPCGSGKKLKFCCSDLIADIEKIQRMLEGDQPRAALSHLEKTLAKHTDRDSLLDMKATIELSLGDLDEAQASIERLIAAHPQHPNGHAHAAILAARQEDASSAVASLQDALELLTEDMPGRVLQAISATGQALLIRGNLIAARAHLWLYQGIAGREDTRAMELLVRLNQSAGLPLLLRDHLYLQELPEGHAAEASHDQSQVLASRGQWRRAAELLDALCDEHQDLAPLHYNRALVRGWLGEVEPLVAGLRYFAELVYGEEDYREAAVEAQAIAQLLDPTLQSQRPQAVRYDLPVRDEEGLTDRLLKDKRAVAQPLSDPERAAVDGPPPRATYLLLDRPQVESGADLTVDSVPRIVGFLSYYGRQTDREERLELVADRDQNASQASPNELALKAIGDLAGDTVEIPADEPEVMGESSLGEGTSYQRWHFPGDTLPTRRRELILEDRKAHLAGDWLKKPLPALLGKTPEQAAGDPELQLPLSAMLLVLGQEATPPEVPIYAKLYETLGVTRPAVVDPRQADLDLLPLVRIEHADFSQASDEQLASLYERAVLAGANRITVAVASEALGRPSTTGAMPREDLYYRIISLETDSEIALSWIDKARATSDAEGKSNATWDILELELRVLNGDMEAANLMVQHLRDTHLDEPGIAEQLYQLLYTLGAVPPPSAADPAAAMGGAPAAAGPGAGPAPAPAAESKLWTPDSAGDSGGGGSKKLWTPS